MTTDDLRAQKGLAMLEADEACKGKLKAESDYQALLAAIGAARGVAGSNADPETLRGALGPYQNIVNVDVLVEAAQRCVDARRQEREAEQKLNVFGR